MTQVTVDDYSTHVDESKSLCRKFECRKDIQYKTQTGTSCEKCNSKAFRLGIEPASSGRGFDIYIHRHYHLIKIYTELAPKLSATASVAQW